jgi:hypothetical protein
MFEVRFKVIMEDLDEFQVNFDTFLHKSTVDCI